MVVKSRAAAAATYVLLTAGVKTVSTPAGCSGEKANVQQQSNPPGRKCILGHPRRAIGGEKLGGVAHALRYEEVGGGGERCGGGSEV